MQRGPHSDISLCCRNPICGWLKMGQADWDKLTGTSWVIVTHVAPPKSLLSPLRAMWRHRLAFAGFRCHLDKATAYNHHVGADSGT